MDTSLSIAQIFLINEDWAIAQPSVEFCNMEISIETAVRNH